MKIVSERRSPLPIGCLVAAAVVGTAAIAGGAFLYFRYLAPRSLTPLDSARVIPQNATFAASVASDASAWSRLETLLPEDARQQWQDRWREIRSEAIAGVEIDYQRDVEPWLGDIAWAVVSDDTNNASPLIVVQIEDKIQALQFFQRIEGQIEEKGDRSSQTSRHRGVEIQELSEPGEERTTFVALLNYQLAIAFEREVIHQAIDAYKGEPSFADKPGAKEALALRTDLTDPIVELYFADLPAVARDFAADLPGSTQIPESTLAAFDVMRSLVVGVAAEDGGLHVQGIANWNPEAIPETAARVSPSILAPFPDRTLVALSGGGLGRVWSGLQEQDDPQLQQGLANGRSFFQFWGLDIERDLIGWMDGDFAFGIVANPSTGGGSSPSLGGAAIFTTSDRDLAEQTLAKLDRLARTRPIFQLRERSAGGVEYREWLNFQRRSLFSYGWRDRDSVLVTFGEADFPTFARQNSGNSLLESDEFRAATAALPTTNSGYLYANFGELLALVPPFATATIPSESEAFLDALGGMALTTTQPDATSGQMDLFLSFERE